MRKPVYSNLFFVFFIPPSWTNKKPTTHSVYSLLVVIDFVIRLYFDSVIDVLVIVDERQAIGFDYDFDYGLVVVVHVLEVNAIVPHQ